MSAPRSTRRGRHARPGPLSRPIARRAALAAGAVGVLAVPVSATLIAEQPMQASAAARTALPVTVAPAADPARLAAAAAAVDAQVGAQMATAAMDTAAQQAAAAAAARALAQRAADEQAAAERASRSRDLAVAAPDVPVTSGDPRSIARSMLAARGQAGQFSCLDSLWSKESGWSTTADNPSSSAYGIPQALPGSKMASAGADWRTNPATQIAWGLSYIEDRYGSPCAAWSHSRASNWY